MFDRYTDCARQTTRLAYQEAQGLKHAYVGTEHLLLGLVRASDATAMTVIQNLGTDARPIRIRIMKRVQHGTDECMPRDLTRTDALNAAFLFAEKEAHSMGDGYVDTEHLLLGLLSVQAGIACEVLESLGFNLHDTRQEVLNVLGKNPQLPSAPPFEVGIQQNGKLLWIRPLSPVGLPPDALKIMFQRALAYLEQNSLQAVEMTLKVT